MASIFDFEILPNLLSKALIKLLNRANWKISSLPLSKNCKINELLAG